MFCKMSSILTDLKAIGSCPKVALKNQQIFANLCSFVLQVPWNFLNKTIANKKYNKGLFTINLTIQEQKYRNMIKKAIYE